MTVDSFQWLPQHPDKYSPDVNFLLDFGHGFIANFWNQGKKTFLEVFNQMWTSTQVWPEKKHK